jgi:phage baseplate assembly protein W
MTWGTQNWGVQVWGVAADVTDPVVSNQSPASGETGVEQQPTVLFDLTDAGGAGLDVNATLVWINGVPAWQSDSPLPPWSGSKLAITDGFRYSLPSPGIFLGLSEVSVRVYGADTVGNDVDTTWTFTIGPEGVLIPKPADPVDSAFIGAIDSPYRYGSDLKLTGDERAMSNNMINSVMIKRGGIPLRYDLGSRVPLLPFDPNDDALREEIVAEVERAVAVGEPRVTVDGMVRLYEREDNTAQVAIAYYPNNFIDSEPRLLLFPIAGLDTK